MAISRKRKEELVASYTQLLENSDGLVVTEYRGMKMNAFHNIRGALRSVNGSYIVTKNRLFKIALADAGMPIPNDLLTGPVAVGFSGGDLPGMIKALLDQKKTQDLLILKGAIVGQSVIGESDLKALSELPTLDELRAQLLGMLVQPAQGLLGVLQAPSQDLVSVLDAGVSSLARVLAAYVAKQENAA